MNDISVVTSLYYSEEYIKEFYLRTLKVCEENFENFEIIFVNDGSPDNSSELVKTLCINDNRIKLIELSRNFGHHKALLTGLDFASKNLIWLIDVDLEEEPEWLKEFYSTFQKNKVDVVYGVQKKRKGNFFERWSGRLFFAIMDDIFDVSFQKNCTTARLMTKAYKDSLCLHKEQNTVLFGLWKITGYKQIPIYVSKGNRSASTYSLLKKIKLAINSIIDFSAKPLIYIFYLGFCIFLISLLFAIYLVVKFFLFASPVVGWTSVIISIWLFGGLIIGILGLLGIYLSKIFMQTKNRPFTIVKEIFP